MARPVSFQPLDDGGYHFDMGDGGAPLYAAGPEADQMAASLVPSQPMGINPDVARAATGMPQPADAGAERTKLSADEEKKFQAWAKQKAIKDVDAPLSFYDYRGAYKAQAQRGGDQHWTDEFKQHGHPSFSVESNYSKDRGDGGSWVGDTYVPGDAAESGKYGGAGDFDPTDRRTAGLDDAISGALAQGRPPSAIPGGTYGPISSGGPVAPTSAADAARAAQSAPIVAALGAGDGPNVMSSGTKDPRVAAAQAAKMNVAAGFAPGGARRAGAPPPPGAAPLASAAPPPAATGYRQGGFIPASKMIEGPAPIDDDTALGLKRGVTNEMTANTDAGAAGAEQAQKDFDIRQGYQDQLKRLDLNEGIRERIRQDEIEARVKEADATAQAAKNGQIDPGHLWQNTSKPMAAIAMALGGLASGALGTGRNEMQSHFDKMIDDDIHAQEKQLQGKQLDAQSAINMLGQQRQLHGDERSAFLGTKAAKIQSLMGDLDAAAEQYKGTQAEINARKANAGLLVSYNETMAKLQQATTEKVSFKYQPGGPTGPAAATQPIAKDDERFLSLPDGTTIHASSKAQAEEWGQILPAADRVERNVDEATQLLAAPGFQDAERAKLAINQAVNSMAPLVTGGKRSTAMGELETVLETLKTGGTVSSDVSHRTRRALELLKDEAIEARNRIYNSGKRYTDEIIDPKTGTFVHAERPREAHREKLELKQVGD